MKISLCKAQRFLIYCFAFFGPLGSLLSPHFMPKALRGYHFLLLFSPFFLIRLKTKEWKTLLVFLPFFAYCLISAYFTENKSLEQEASPFLRCGLLITQCLFMFGAAFCMRAAQIEIEKKRLLKLYLAGFFLSLIVGYALLLGYYTQRISFQDLSKWCVEAQVGWNFLRFSPGSYPNEYGNVSSFVLIVLILILAERKKTSLFLYLFIGMTFIALLLTTTRSAYLSFILTFFYLFLVSKPLRFASLKFMTLSIICITLIQYYSFNFLYIFKEGIKKISLTSGSTGIRFTEWVKGFQELALSTFWGTGFGSQIGVHNIYLEFLYELGIVGAAILCITLLYYLSENSSKIRPIFVKKAMEQKDVLYNRITAVGLIHIFLFAGSNHNMHHHLTWFIFLFFNMSLFSELKSASSEPLSDGALPPSYKRPLFPQFLR